MIERRAAASHDRVREDIVEPIRRSVRWLASLRDPLGRIFCREHRVEHTGNNAGAIVTACELLKIDAPPSITLFEQLNGS